MRLLRVRIVVEDFPAALPFYAALLDGACVTKAPEVDAAHIWTGREGAEIELLSTEVAAAKLGEHLAAPRDVAPGATRFARVRAADGCLVEVTRPQVPTLGTPLVALT